MKNIIRYIDFILKYRMKFFITNPAKLFSGTRVLFYPELPHRRSVMYKICRLLGVKIISDKNSKYDAVVLWEDKTNSELYIFDNKGLFEINTECVDISKTFVDEKFNKVFNYRLNIDPLTYKGKCVIKSEENAQHDGEIISCPIEKKLPGVVYQVVLNNFENDSLVKDIRVPIIGGEIPFVYFKFKTKEKRFTNDINSVEVNETKNVFTDEEIRSIIKFSEEMKLNYGELDVLRNLDDNKIYIVDVNKTPWGPPAGISENDSKEVLQKLTDSFRRQFLNIN